MHKNPIAYFPLEALLDSPESFWKTRREEEVVRSNIELIMKGVNFCELRKRQKMALKPTWVEVMREKVEAGRYKSPIANNMASAARKRPRRP